MQWEEVKEFDSGNWLQTFIEYKNNNKIQLKLETHGQWLFVSIEWEDWLNWRSLEYYRLRYF